MIKRILLIFVVLLLPVIVSAKECGCEVKFKKAYPVVWRGKIIAGFVSGTDFALSRTDLKPNYPKFYLIADGKISPEVGDVVTIKGKMVGLTCAYNNTVFKAKNGCVPEVELSGIVK